MTESPPAPLPPETAPPQPLPPIGGEVQRKPNVKVLIGVILVVVIVAGVLGGYIVYSRLRPGTQVSSTSSPGFNTYSKYGFSFQYPSGMTITESGLLDSVATSTSGIVSGEKLGSSYEFVLVGWTRSVNSIPLDATLNGAFSGMSQAQGVTSVVKGQQAETSKAGYRVLYQYFTITSTDRNASGVYSVWYSTGGQRLYQLAVMYYSQNVFPIYQRYLSSFVAA